jgi:lysophospholipase L1-like esterase
VGKALLVLAGVGTALVAIELTLQLGSLIVAPRGAGREPTSGRRTILTLGDSHTYGIRSEEEESYPGRLQTLLDRRAPGVWEVVNLGLPGTNSSQLVLQFPDSNERYRPTMSIVMVGINNTWNLRGIDDTRKPPPWRWSEGLRIVRLFRVLRAGAPAPAPRQSRPLVTRVLSADRSVIRHLDTETGEFLIEHHVRRLDARLDPSASAALLRRDLERLKALHDAAGVELVLLTYAAPITANEALNGVMRRLARRHGLRLVDVCPRFKELLDGGAVHSDYFLWKNDGHPTAEGYAEIARLVADTLEPRTP